MISSRPTGTQIFFALALVLEIGLVAWMSATVDFAQPGSGAKFAVFGFAAGAAYLVAVVAFEKVYAGWRTGIFWVVAILLRLLALPMTPDASGLPPVTDIHGQAGSELSVPASESWVDGEAERPPGGLIFSGPAAEPVLARIRGVGESTVWPKLILVLADLGVVYFLLRLNLGGRRRHRDTAWYAWNPLVVCAFAGLGYPGSLLLLLLSAFFWALYRADPMGRQAPAWSWSLLAIGFLGVTISLSWAAVIFLPSLVVALKQRFWIALLTPLPAVWVADRLGTPLWYPDFWVRLEPVHATGLVWGWVPGWDRLPGGALVALILIAFLVVVWAVLLRRDWSRSALYAAGTALIFAPVLHPWWAAAILPLACWRKTLPWFVLSISIFALFPFQASVPVGAPADWSGFQNLLVILPPLLILLRRRWRGLWR